MMRKRLFSVGFLPRLTLRHFEYGGEREKGFNSVL